MNKLKISNVIEKSTFSSNMFKQVNDKGEKVNIILNGLKEADKILEFCPVEHYIVHMTSSGCSIDPLKIERIEQNYCLALTKIFYNQTLLNRYIDEQHRVL